VLSTFHYFISYSNAVTFFAWVGTYSLLLVLNLWHYREEKKKKRQKHIHWSRNNKGHKNKEV